MPYTAITIEVTIEPKQLEATSAQTRTASMLALAASPRRGALLFTAAALPITERKFSYPNDNIDLNGFFNNVVKFFEDHKKDASKEEFNITITKKHTDKSKTESEDYSIGRVGSADTIDSMIGHFDSLRKEAIKDKKEEQDQLEATEKPAASLPAVSRDHPSSKPL